MLGCHTSGTCRSGPRDHVFSRTQTCMTLMYDIFSPTTCEQSSQCMAGGTSMKATCQQATCRKCRMCSGTVHAACTLCAEHFRQAPCPIKRTLRHSSCGFQVHIPTAKGVAQSEQTNNQSARCIVLSGRTWRATREGGQQVSRQHVDSANVHRHSPGSMRNAQHTSGVQHAK